MTYLVKSIEVQDQAERPAGDMIYTYCPTKWDAQDLMRDLGFRKNVKYSKLMGKVN